MSLSFRKNRFKEQTHSGGRRSGQVTPNLSALQGSPLKNHVEVSLQTYKTKSKTTPQEWTPLRGPDVWRNVSFRLTSATLSVKEDNVGNYLEDLLKQRLCDSLPNKRPFHFQQPSWQHQNLNVAPPEAEESGNRLESCQNRSDSSSIPLKLHMLKHTLQLLTCHNLPLGFIQVTGNHVPHTGKSSNPQEKGLGWDTTGTEEKSRKCVGTAVRRSPAPSETEPGAAGPRRCDSHQDRTPKSREEKVRTENQVGPIPPARPALFKDLHLPALRSRPRRKLDTSASTNAGGGKSYLVY